MEAYLEGTEPDEETLKACIRKGTVAGAFVPVLNGSAFKNKGVQLLLDAVVDYLPAPDETHAIRGVDDGHRQGDHPQQQRRRAVLRTGLQDHDRPLRGVAFVHQDLFRRSQERRDHPQHRQGKARAGRPHAADARQLARGGQPGPGRRHRRAGRAQGHHHRRDPVRPAPCGGAGAHRVSRSGDRDRGRAQDQVRPGEDVRRARPPRPGGSELPGLGRRRERPDRHQGDGRAAPRNPGRPHAPRIQGRRQCRHAPGGLSRDRLQGRRA